MNTTTDKTDVSAVNPVYEHTADAIAIVLISKGVKVRRPYSVQGYGVHVTISLNEIEWEGEGGEGGKDFAERLQRCAMNLKCMRAYVPEGLLDEIKVAEAILLLSFLDTYRISQIGEKAGEKVG